MAYGGARRSSGRTVRGGFGLLALVVTLGIMAILAGRVLDSSPVTSSDDAPVPGDVGRTAQSAPDDTASSNPSPMAGADAAQLAACEADRSVLELASAAYATRFGGPPSDQAALVDAGLLGAEVATHRLEVSSAGAVVVGVGDCATS